MKKLILVFVAFAIAIGGYAQSGSTNGTTSPQDMNKTQKQSLQNNPVGNSHPDGAIMQNGKMMQVKNGQMTSLDNEMTMNDGTKIMSDGTCIKKDGTKMTMKEGQHMDMSGNMNTTKKNKDNNMYLVPDSTKKRNNK